VSAVRFAFVLHNHQPVGNFDFVIEEAYARAYEPFLAFLERRADVRIALHNSGCLWEWLELRHPEYGRRVERLLARRQIELLGGGFFEPILPLWPERDRRGQVRRMQGFLRERFGLEARGIWLAERVWEPHLVGDLAAEGIRYLFLDDTQFLPAGYADEDLDGHLLTEDSGRTVALFPIQMRLRYEIPFADPAVAAATLKAQASERPGALRLFGDDGEKFGVWPGTEGLCAEGGWLDRFFDRIRGEAGTIRMVLPGEHVADTPARGRVYLPPGSYREMGEWALPLEARRLVEEERHRRESEERAREADLVLRSGFFRNFLVRYTEAGWMHARVRFAHAELDRAHAAAARGEGELPDAAAIRDRLWRAQCNCAYWHGVFGGLYLPHLRDAIYREVVRAEEAMARSAPGKSGLVEVRRTDLDADGSEEILLASGRQALFLAPHRGGSLLEWDDRTSGRNLVNSLTRRPEAYHAQLTTPVVEPEAAPVEGEPKARTIHDRIEAKQEGLEEWLHYDRRPRAFAVDRLLPRVPEAWEIPDIEDLDLARLADASYEAEDPRVQGPRAELVLRSTAELPGGARLELRKRFALEAEEDGFLLEYRLGATGGAVRTVFATELVVNLLAGQAHDRSVWVDGRIADPPVLAGFGAHPGAQVLALLDEFEGMRVSVTAPGAGGFLRAPLWTVSLSESGAERIFQGTLLLPYWRIALAPGEEARCVLRFGIERTASGGRPH
jgi:alpha-amylase